MKKLINFRKVAISVAVIVAATFSLTNVQAAPSTFSTQDVPACSDSGNGAHCLAVEHQFFINGVREKDVSHLQSDLRGAGINPSVLNSDASASAANTRSGVTLTYPLTATELRALYGTPTVSSATATVGIVDVWDPNYSLTTLRSDFAAYQASTVYGNSGVAGQGTLKIFNQSGATLTANLNTSGSKGWGVETALDIDMVSAICPSCTIVLVLANTASFSDLATAVTAAAAQTGVSAISNSYGGGGNTNGSSYPAYSNAALNKNIAVTASAGDNGYGNSDPADFTNVIGVGGTSVPTTGGAAAQTIWTGTGSGCSTANNARYETGTSCSGKAVSDISAVANPNTGVAVSYAGSWSQYGGTSVASPIIATYLAMTSRTWQNFTLTGNAVGYSKAAAWLWSLPANTYADPTASGTNAGRRTCNPAIWCHTGAGWDGPTGRGTPQPGSVF